MAVIELVNVTKSFGDIHAVRGIDVSVDEGEVFGFLGPNGAGKSTAVKMMVTLLTPTSGTVRVAGIDVTEDPTAVRSRIGCALQEAGLDGLATAREFLTLQATLYGLADPRARAEELLDTVGLVDAADRRIGGFSGGMKRRVDLAAALVHRPQVLFLDEPTTGLDPASRMQVWDEVRRLQQQGTTIFLTTQYLEEADQLAGRIAIIDAGLIVEEGTPTQLKKKFGGDVVEVTVSDEHRDAAHAAATRVAAADDVMVEGNVVRITAQSGADVVPALVRALDTAEVAIGALAMRQATLDDVFLAATGNHLEGNAVATPDNDAAPGDAGEGDA